MIVFGENVSSIVTSVRFRASMFSPVNAVIASGVCCRFSSRKRAETVISSRPELCARATSPVKMARLRRNRARHKAPARTVVFRCST